MRFLPLIVLAAACTSDIGNDNRATDTGTVNDVDRDGFSSADGDCDDEDPRTFPGAWDIVGDEVDQNCDGIDGIDDDGDDQAWTGSGGTDCDDTNPAVFDGAEEIGWDGIDQNCDLRDQFDFDQLCAGDKHTCGIDTTSRVRCWGIDDLQTRNVPANDGTVWQFISCSEDATCAVSLEGELYCWGSENPEEGLAVSEAPVEGVPVPGRLWKNVYMGSYHGCATDDSDEAWCWGNNQQGQTEVPQGAQWLSLGPGLEHTCGIRRGRQRIECWGAEGPDDVVSTIPPFKWAEVTSGHLFSCGIREDRGRDCWGDDIDLTLPRNEKGPWGQLDAGDRFLCGIKEQVPSCVGRDNIHGVIANVPTNIDMRFVTAGSGHACGLRSSNGEVVCWGKNTDGQATVPRWQ